MTRRKIAFKRSLDFCKWRKKMFKNTKPGKDGLMHFFKGRQWVVASATKRKRKWGESRSLHCTFDDWKWRLMSKTETCCSGGKKFKTLSFVFRLRFMARACWRSELIIIFLLLVFLISFWFQTEQAKCGNEARKQQEENPTKIQWTTGIVESRECFNNPLKIQTHGDDEVSETMCSAEFACSCLVRWFNFNFF